MSFFVLPQHVLSLCLKTKHNNHVHCQRSVTGVLVCDWFAPKSRWFLSGAVAFIFIGIKRQKYCSINNTEQQNAISCTFKTTMIDAFNSAFLYESLQLCDVMFLNLFFFYDEKKWMKSICLANTLIRSHNWLLNDRVCYSHCFIISESLYKCTDALFCFCVRRAAGLLSRLCSCEIKVILSHMKSFWTDFT